MRLKFAFCTILMQMVLNLLSAQTVIEIDRPTVSKLTNHSVWECSLTNSDPIAHTVYIKGKIDKLNKGIVYEAVSQPFVINAQQNIRIDASIIIIKQLIVNKFNTEVQLTEGSYTLNFDVYDSNNNMLLATNQLLVSADEVGNTSNGQMKAQSSMNKPFSTSGNVYLLHQYNPLIATFTQLPNNQLIRFEGTPSVTIKGIPVSSNILYSNENNPYSGTINQFNVHFDYYRFKENMQKILLEKIDVLKERGKIGDVQHIKDEYISRNNPEIQKLKAKLNSDEFTDIEQKAKAHEGDLAMLAAIKDNPDFYNYRQIAINYAISHSDSLEQLKDKIPKVDYEKIKWYLIAKNTYDKIHNKADSVQLQLRKVYAEYNKISEKVKKIESVSYEEVLNDPLSMEKYLSHFMPTNKLMKIASLVQNVNVGSAYPYYSDITLMGMRTKGFHIELNPKNYYLAITKGKIEGTGQFGYPINNANRSLQVMRFGYGKKEGTHLFFNYLRMQDNALFADTSGNRPQDNLIVGGEMQLSLFKKKLLLKAEMAQSYHTYDRTVRDSALMSGEDYFNQNLDFGLNSTSHKDKAYNVELAARFNNDNTVMSGYYKYIGAGYMSLALPFILRGVERYEGRLSQYFWKRQLSIGAFIRNDVDNVLLSRTIANYNNSMGMDMGLYVKKLPMIKISFAPTKQTSINTMTGDKVYGSKLYMMSLTLSHAFTFKEVFFLTALNSTKFLGNLNKEAYNGDNLTIQQSIQFKKPIGLNVSYSTLRQSFDKETQVLIEKGAYTSVTGTAKLGKLWNTNVGYSHSTTTNYPQRDNVFVEGSYRVMKNMGLRLRVNYLTQKGNLPPSALYNNYINNGFGTRLMLTMDW